VLVSVAHTGTTKRLAIDCDQGGLRQVSSEVVLTLLREGPEDPAVNDAARVELVSTPQVSPRLVLGRLSFTALRT
jgi:hypothetical protein